MYYDQYALGFGHDIYAYYKLYKFYLYIKISHRYLLGLRADRAFAGYEQKRIYTIMYIIVTLLFLWLLNDCMQHTHIIIIDPRRSQVCTYIYICISAPSGTSVFNIIVMVRESFKILYLYSI